MNPYEFAEAHYEEFLNDLKDLIRIPSISTMSEHKGDIRRAAEWLKAHLDAIGMTRTEIFETPGHPIVFAEWHGAGDAPTLLVYGHYDVQPVDDPEHQWLSDPFEPFIRDGNLFARGATDDKGQTMVQVNAAHSLIATRQMPFNVKFIIEGEEENGSTSLYPFIEQHAELLSADVVVISDSHILGLDRPSIVTGLRGMVYMEIEVRGPEHDLHSGTYGGLVHNPAQALAEIIAALHDQGGQAVYPPVQVARRIVRAAGHKREGDEGLPAGRSAKEGSDGQAERPELVDLPAGHRPGQDGLRAGAGNEMRNGEAGIRTRGRGLPPTTV